MGDSAAFPAQVSELEDVCVSKADAALVVLALRCQREVALLFQTVQDAAVFVYAASGAVAQLQCLCLADMCFGMLGREGKLCASAQYSAVPAAKWTIHRRGISAQCSAPWCPAVPREQRRFLRALRCAPHVGAWHIVWQLTGRQVFGNCVCAAQVVVPQKMFVMYSQAASYPVHTLSLANAIPLHDGPSRTVALQVHSVCCTMCLAMSEQLADDPAWQHRLAAGNLRFEAAQNRTRSSGCLHCQTLHRTGAHEAGGTPCCRLTVCAAHRDVLDLQGNKQPPGSRRAGPWA